MSSSKWLGSIASRVSSARDMAANKIGQAAKKLDEKLKVAEADLEKSRFEFKFEFYFCNVFA